MLKIISLCLSFYIILYSLFYLNTVDADEIKFKINVNLFTGEKTCVQDSNGSLSLDQCNTELQNGKYKFVGFPGQPGAKCQANANGDLTYSECLAKLNQQKWRVLQGAYGEKLCVEAANGTLTYEQCQQELQNGKYQYNPLGPSGPFCQPNVNGKYTYDECQSLIKTGTKPGKPGQNPCATYDKLTGEPTLTDCPTALGDIPTNPKAFAERVLQIGIGLGGGIAFILMVLGSIRVLTSSGDQQKLSGGRDMIVAAIAGLLFIIFSVIILRFIGIEILQI